MNKLYPTLCVVSLFVAITALAVVLYAGGAAAHDRIAIPSVQPATINPDSSDQLTSLAVRVSALEATVQSLANAQNSRVAADPASSVTDVPSGKLAPEVQAFLRESVREYLDEKELLALR